MYDIFGCVFAFQAGKKRDIFSFLISKTKQIHFFLCFKFLCSEALQEICFMHMNAILFSNNHKELWYQRVMVSNYGTKNYFWLSYW